MKKGAVAVGALTGVMVAGVMVYLGEKFPRVKQGVAKTAKTVAECPSEVMKKVRA